MFSNRGVSPRFLAPRGTDFFSDLGAHNEGAIRNGKEEKGSQGFQAVPEEEGRQEVVGQKVDRQKEIAEEEVQQGEVEDQASVGRIAASGNALGLVEPDGRRF